MNNDYCIMYNERFALTGEAILFKKLHYTKSLILNETILKSRK